SARRCVSGARRVPPGPAVRRPPVRGALVRADHVPDLCPREPRQLRRRLRRRLRVRRDHLGGRPLPRPRVGLRLRLRLLHRDDVRAARGADGPSLVSRALPWIGGAALAALPFVYQQPYPLHILVIILIWSFAYTSWSVMRRFGLVSL